MLLVARRRGEHADRARRAVVAGVARRRAVHHRPDLRGHRDVPREPVRAEAGLVVAAAGRDSRRVLVVLLDDVERGAGNGDDALGHDGYEHQVVAAAVEPVVVDAHVGLVGLRIEKPIWKKLRMLPHGHLLLDNAPNIGPLISPWELDEFKNC